MDEQTPPSSPADEPTTSEPDHRPPLRKEAAAFYGYTPFPPLMAVYTDFSGLTAPLRTLRLCAGTSKADLLYMVDIHYGYTPRRPLQFRPGLYLRNGATAKAPILAAAGDEARRPLLVSTFNLESVILLPPVDLEAKNPRDVVTEVLRASTTSNASGIESSTRLVTFHFAIEVGVKMRMREREEFEWVDVSSLGRSSSSKTAPTPVAHDSRGTSSSASAAADPDTTKGTRFVLLRCPRPPRTATSTRRSESAPSSSLSSSKAAQNFADQDQILAELVFTKAMSWNRLFSLELKGAGRTGELGDRWTLMVVMTALRIYWLRSYGKTGKGVVRVGEKVRGI